MARLIRAQLGFVQSGHPTTTESAVADAVNFFGPLLDSAVYTGTNATQIRLLRLSFFFEVRHLLQAANRSAMEPLGDNTLSPVRNPRNGAAIFAVPRLNLLCSCEK